MREKRWRLSDSVSFFVQSLFAKKVLVKACYFDLALPLDTKLLILVIRNNSCPGGEHSKEPPSPTQIFW